MKRLVDYVEGAETLTDSDRDTLEMVLEFVIVAPILFLLGLGVLIGRAL